MKEIAPGIIVDSHVRFAKPIIKGTRITAEEVLGFLASGTTYKEIEKEYGLKKDAVLAVVRYAAMFLRGEAELTKV